MYKISDAIRDIIEKNYILRFGIQHRLLNLSSLAKYLRPLIEVRIKKEITDSAILMNLSRLQAHAGKWPKKKEYFRIRDLTVKSGLFSITYHSTPEILEKIKTIYTIAHKTNSYITLNQGAHEVTFIVDETTLQKIRDLYKQKPKYTTSNLAALGIHFDEKYVYTPGIIYYLIQQMTLQNINIAELSSTFTELVIYIAEKDIKLAFDTIYAQFLS